MTPPDNDRGRPGEKAASNVKNGDTSRVPRPADVLADLDAVAEHLRGYLVLQVQIDDNGHRRTQVYRSAAAAERAVKRANERGRIAHVSLCQLLPVGVVTSLGQRPPTAPAARKLTACVWCGGSTTSTDAEPMHPVCLAAHAARGEAS